MIGQLAIVTLFGAILGGIPLSGPYPSQVGILVLAETFSRPCRPKGLARPPADEIFCSTIVNFREMPNVLQRLRVKFKKRKKI